MVVGLAGGIIALAALPFSWTRHSTGRFLLSFALLILHAIACGAYYYYAQHNPADSAVYYFDMFNLSAGKFGFGSVFTARVTQVLRKDFGGSYLECFIFFQGIGFWGIAILMKSFDEIHSKLRSSQTVLPYWILFLPSIHFWTSAIGKDVPLFFAVSLSTWSSLQWRRRLMPFLISLAIMILFRAHIALIVLMSLALAAVLHPGFSFGRKAILLGGAIVGAIILAGSVQSAISVNITSASSVATFFQNRNDIAAKVGGTTTFGNAAFVVRFIALLFRPFFFDANGILGIIASIENVGSVLLFFYLVLNWKRIRFLSNRVFFVEFCATVSAMLIFLLTVVNYNVGLGLRERIMVLPPLFCLFVATWVSRGITRDAPLPSSVSVGSKLLTKEPITSAAAAGSFHAS